MVCEGLPLILEISKIKAGTGDDILVWLNLGLAKPELYSPNCF